MKSYVLQRTGTVALSSLLGVPAFAASLGVNVEIPRLQVAEYHRPYVAMWLERTDPSAANAATTLAVWYDVKMKNDEGTKWLKDMRQWWRRAGRELSVPIDGVTSPTRPAGKHAQQFTEGSPALPRLAAGSYKLVVEAAREVGGRETVTIPFTWPPQSAQPTQLSAKGSTELGEIKLDLKP